MAQRKSWLFVLATGLIFGTLEVSLKIAGNDYTPLQLTFLRFLLGGLILLPFALRDLHRRGYRLTRSDWLYLLALGVINICISMTLFQVGMKYTNASLGSVILSANPIFTMIFSHFLVHDRFTRKKAVVLALSIVGLVIVADPRTLFSGGDMLGLLLVLTASIGFGLFSALGKKRIGRIGGLTLNCMSFLLGSVVELGVLLAIGEPIFTHMTWHALGVLLYTGVVITGLGYVCYMKAIELSGPSAASTGFFIKPVVAIILSALILSEPVTGNIVVGTVLILAGFIYNLLSSRKTPKA